MVENIMNIYIKVAKDYSATLMTESGEALWKFASLSAARQACGDLQHCFELDMEQADEDLSCSNCLLS